MYCLISTVSFTLNGKMRVFGYLFLMICNFKPNGAKLKACAEKHDQLELCLTRDTTETIESGPLCITDLFQNKSVAYF